ncbi:MAG: hypothetical protein O3B70_09295 [Bacteroidetes bacterium]|nr:hypothetical protein [Bacteroidota bacterium]MDA0904517.1 hypothetical protein [Bacteroidota bacterium]MDA1242261.1 hypothetical protein [Bacteroidota bacterium]
MKSLHVVLFCVLFLLVGFALGRVTGHGNHARGVHRHVPGGHAVALTHAGSSTDVDEVEVIVVAADASEGDSLVLPRGGVVRMRQDGNHMEVEVDVEVDDEQRVTSVERSPSDAGAIKTEKRIIIVREEDNSNEE